MQGQGSDPASGSGQGSTHARSAHSHGPSLKSNAWLPPSPPPDTTLHETLLPRYPDGFEAVWDEGVGMVQ